MERLAKTAALVHLASLALGCLDALDMEKSVERPFLATALGSAGVHVVCGLDCKHLDKEPRTHIASVTSSFGLLGSFRFTHLEEKHGGTD